MIKKVKEKYEPMDFLVEANVHLKRLDEIKEKIIMKKK
jgi:hypothetical protein